MKATFKPGKFDNARNWDGEKERVNSWKVVAPDPTLPDGICELIDARCYMGKSRNASTVYASVWIHGPGSDWHSGRGNAGGYGYHKESAAIGDALASAGVELWGSPYSNEQGDETKRAHINGCGSSSIEAALRAIAAALGYSQVAIV